MSPGRVVMGGDSCYKGREFNSWHCILDGHFSQLFFVKIVMMFFRKGEKFEERGQGLFFFLKKNNPFFS